MNELQIFNNSEFGEVRTVLINNEPYFVGKDVAEILGYKDTSDALKRHVDDEDKLTRCFTDSGQNREMYVINESGMYSLILSSKLPNAKKFKHWVTSEVLPSIRKTGSYNMPTSYKEALKQLLIEVEEKERLALENNELKENVIIMDKAIGEMKPKADYYDIILATPDCMLTTQIAQDYGLSAKTFNKMLYQFRIQYKIGDQWILYADHLGKGYTKTKTNTFTGASGIEHSRPSTVWTQKGRFFLYEELKKNGVLPTIEQ